MKLYFLPLLSLIVIFISPAYSANLSTERESELRNILKTAVSSIGAEANTDQIEITQNGKFFSTTIPDITINNGGNTTTRIDAIAVNAIPIENDTWKLSFTLPNEIITYNINGTPIIALGVEKQTSSVIFDSTRNVILSSKVLYNDVSINAVSKKRTINIKELSVIKDWEKDSNNNVSGPLLYTLNGVTAQNSGQEILSIDNITLRSNIENHNLNHPLYIEDASLKHDNKYDIFNNIVKKYIDNSDSISFAATLDNINIKTYGYSRLQNDSNISNISLGVDIKDLRKDKSTLDLRISHKSDDTPSLRSSISPFIPHNTDINLSLDNLKKSNIIDMLLDPSLEDRNNSNNTLRLRLVSNLIPYLSESFSNLNINSFIIDAASYGVDIKGKAQANDTAKYKSTLSLTATLRGLDTINDIMSGLLGKRTGLNDKIKKLASTISILRLVGIQQGNEDIRDYSVEIDKIGTVILNGTDISSLAGNQGYTPVPNLENRTDKSLPY